MGWASGSELAQQIWNDMKSHLTEKQKKTLKNSLIKHFEDMDCDTMDEVDWK